ncbi:putative transcriptional regulator YdeE [Paenibacillus sp. V4I7]|nr:putative transcriptional regulator YdeE [Paenibacillus sp. V4I7]
MEYRIENLDYELRIIGKSIPVKICRAFKAIPTLWNSAKKDGFMQKLIDMSWEKTKCTLERRVGKVCYETKGNDSFITRSSRLPVINSVAYSVNG